MTSLRPVPEGGRAPRRWAAFAAALALTAAVGAPATAASSPDCNPNVSALIYPPVDCAALLATNSIRLGGSLGIVGAGFKPTTSVSVQLHSSVIALGTLTSDATGMASGAVVIPTSVPLGTHELDLTGVNPDGAPRQLTATVQIEGIAHTSSTGSGPGALFWTAIGVVALALFGAVLLLALRRSRGGGAG